MFGEIDCREGLLLAIEKLKYDNMEAAMAVLLDIYVETLLDLVEKRKFTIYVHPVPSVLNETRHVVRPFNTALRQKVPAVSCVGLPTPILSRRHLPYKRAKNSL